MDLPSKGTQRQHWRLRLVRAFGLLLGAVAALGPTMLYSVETGTAAGLVPQQEQRQQQGETRPVERNHLVALRAEEHMALELKAHATASSQTDLA